jgi:hypothetical protein
MVSLIGSDFMLTDSFVKSKIKDIQHYQLGLKTVVCLITLDSGHEVIGSSACIDPLDFNLEKGKELAYANAERNVWGLGVYLLER